MMHAKRKRWIGHVAWLALSVSAALPQTAFAQTDGAAWRSLTGESRVIFETAVARFQRATFFTRERFAAQRPEEITPQRPEFFPGSTILSLPESQWKPVFDVVIPWTETRGDSLSLSGTAARVGDVVVLREGGQLLAMVYVGENRFSDWKKVPEAGARRSFFIYPFTRLGGLELNTMPPRWYRNLIEVHKLVPNRPSGEIEFQDEALVSGMRYAPQSGYDSLADDWREFQEPQLNIGWLQSPKILGSLFIPTRWWGSSASYTVLRPGNVDGSVLEAYEIIDLYTLEFPGAGGDYQRPFKLDEDGYVVSDRRIAAANSQYIELVVKRARDRLNPYALQEDLERTESQIEHAEKVMWAVREIVRAEYDRRNIPWGRVAESGRVGNCFITDIFFDGMLSMGFSAGQAITRAALERITVKTATQRQAVIQFEQIAAELGEMTVVRIEKETAEITTKAGQRFLVEKTVQAITSRRGVMQYLRKYGRLPNNFITKDQAKARKWRPGRDLHRYAPGKSIGGDNFRNNPLSNGKFTKVQGPGFETGRITTRLPDKAGRKWYEADINYTGGRRGAERIVYSDDGLIYSTNDHFETFSQLVAPN